MNVHRHPQHSCSIAGPIIFVVAPRACVGWAERDQTRAQIHTKINRYFPQNAVARRAIDSQETGTSCAMWARICALRLEEYLLSDMKHSLKMGPENWHPFDPCMLKFPRTPERTVSDSCSACTRSHPQLQHEWKISTRQGGLIMHSFPRLIDHSWPAESYASNLTRGNPGTWGIRWTELFLLSYTVFPDVLKGWGETRWNESAATQPNLRFKRRFGLKSEVTICQRVVSVFSGRMSDRQLDN